MSKIEDSKKIGSDIDEFLDQGGEVDVVASKPDPDALKKIREKRKELLKEEKKIKAALDADKGNRKELREKIKSTREAFESNRKAHQNNLRKLNRIHMTKSASKNFDEFEEIANLFLLSITQIEQTLDEYLNALREGQPGYTPEEPETATEDNPETNET